MLFQPPSSGDDVLPVELHSHSSLSYDGRDPIEHLLEQAVTAGLNALAVTGRGEIDASLEVAELAADYRLIGIPGMEVTCAVGYVLVLDVEELIPAGLSYDEMLDRIRDTGGIAVIPHPFQKSRHGVAPHISSAQFASADAIEIYNPRFLTDIANQRAERLTKHRSPPMTAGSGAHIAETVGQAVTGVGTDTRSADAILSAVADGRTSVVGNKTPRRISFRQVAGGATRRLKHALTDLF